MSVLLSRAFMALAVRSMGEVRREWAQAMEAEFEHAVDDGRPLAFAAGCLFGAWRGLPTHEEGRFVLASHLVAIGFLVPVATLLVSQTLAGEAASGNVFINSGNRAALPSLAVVSLLLALGHLRLGWVMLDRDWEAARRWTTLNAALSTTLVTVAGAMFLWQPYCLLHAVVTGIELIAVATLFRWDGELPLRVARLSTA